MATHLHYTNDQAAYAEILRRDAQHVQTLIDLGKSMRRGLAQVSTGEDVYHANRSIGETIEKLEAVKARLEREELANREAAKE